MQNEPSKEAREAADEIQYFELEASQRQEGYSIQEIAKIVARFEAETRKDERERCAKVAAGIGEGSSSDNGQIVAARIAAAIRNQEPQP